MNIQPYLIFDGRCEEAIDFYKEALGAEVQMLMRFKDSPTPHDPGMIPPGSEDKIMHASVKIGETVILASDGRCRGKAIYEGFSLSLSVASDAEAEKAFAALAQGGHVHMPLTSTFFASRFGMVADPFGVTWMVIAPA